MSLFLSLGMSVRTWSLQANESADNFTDTTCQSTLNHIQSPWSPGRRKSRQTVSSINLFTISKAVLKKHATHGSTAPHQAQHATHGVCAMSMETTGVSLAIRLQYQKSAQIHSGDWFQRQERPPPRRPRLIILRVSIRLRLIWNWRWREVR